MASGEVAGEAHGAVANADEAAYGVALGVPQAADYAVAAFAQHGAVPAVGAAAALLGQRVEARQAVVEHHAFGEAPQDGGGGQAQHAHEVFALHAKGRMHQPVGQLAVGGQQQQAAGVQVEAAHGYPAASLQPGQGGENGSMLCAAVAGHQLALGLVVGDDAGSSRGSRPDRQQAPVEAVFFAARNALAGNRAAAVHGQAAGGDPALHLAPRCDAGVGQVLLNANQLLKGHFALEARPASEPERNPATRIN